MNVTEEQLRDMLTEAFTSGWYGSLDLLEETVEGMISDAKKEEVIEVREWEIDGDPILIDIDESGEIQLAEDDTMSDPQITETYRVVNNTTTSDWTATEVSGTSISGVRFDTGDGTWSVTI